MEHNKIINLIIIWGLILAVFILSFFVLKPIAIAVIFGLLFAFIFHPLHEKLTNKVRSKNLSAIILILLLIVVVAVPVFYYSPVLIKQSFNLYGDIQDIQFGEIIQSILPGLIDHKIAYSINVNINNVVGQAISGFMDQFVNLLVDLPNLILQGFVFLFTFFFCLRDYKAFGEFLQKISPFSKGVEKKLIGEFRGITNSVILGQVVIGVLQGLAIGLALLLLGVSNVLTFTVLSIIVAIVPVIGAWLIWVPLSIALFFQGDVTNAVILFLYGFLFVSNIDNVLRPYLLSKSSKLPIAISLIGTIGGLYFMGIVGLVLGPLILAYALIIIDSYKDIKFRR